MDILEIMKKTCKINLYKNGVCYFLFALIVLSCIPNNKGIEATWVATELRNYKKKKKSKDYFAYVLFKIKIKNDAPDTLYFIDSNFGKNDIFYKINDSLIFKNIEISPAFETFYPKDIKTLNLIVRTTDRKIDSIGYDNLINGKITFKNYSKNNPHLNYDDSLTVKRRKLKVKIIDSLTIFNSKNIKLYID